MARSRYTVFGSNIIVVSRDGRMLMQRKTAGYRYTAYVGKLCLIGGGWTEPEDRNPRQTALRELAEEVRPRRLFDGADALLQYVGAYELVVPAEISGRQPLERSAARLLTFTFELVLPDFDDVRLLEGEAVVVPSTSALSEPICWGHDHIVADWAAQRWHALPALPLEERVTCAQVGTVEPKDYGELDLERLRINPRRPERRG